MCSTVPTVPSKPDPSYPLGNSLPEPNLNADSKLQAPSPAEMSKGSLSSGAATRGLDDEHSLNIFFNTFKQFIYFFKKKAQLK